MHTAQIVRQTHISSGISLRRNPIANEPFNLSGFCCSFQMKQEINNWPTKKIHCCSLDDYMRASIYFIIYKFQAQWYDAMMRTHTNQRQCWHYGRITDCEWRTLTHIWWWLRLFDWDRAEMNAFFLVFPFCFYRFVLSLLLHSCTQQQQ